MGEKIRGIVVDVRRHNDNTDVVTLFTPKLGRISFLSAASASKAGKMRRARLQPLAIINTEIKYNPNKELHRLGAFSLETVWTGLYSHPHKQLIVMFVAEFLNRLLRASMPDENLWEFIGNSIAYFDKQQRGVNDFTVAFLASLLPFAGIQPDGREYRPGYYFDMQEGRFSEERPSHPDYLEGREAAFAALLTRINFTNIKVLKLQTSQRSQIIRGLLRYYSIHFPGVAMMKTFPL